MNEEVRSHDDTKQFYVNKWRTMEIMNAPLVVKFSEKDFDVFFLKVLLEEKDYIKEDDSMRFIT